MNKLLNLQGNVFIVIVILSITISFMISKTNQTSNDLYFILLIAFFGVPHGSLDVLLAQKYFSITTFVAWSKFLSLYILTSIGIIIFWFLQPALFIVVFLLFSAFHFADDLDDKMPKIIGILYGFNIILFPSILHSQELVQLYSYLINMKDSAFIVSFMPFIAALLSALLIVCLIYFNKYHSDDNQQSLIEIAAVAFLMLFIKPLLAFTIYFCFMHSARHIIRARYFLKNYSNHTFIYGLCIPTIIVMTFCYYIFQSLQMDSLNSGLIKVTFVALAALTFPHAFLLDKIRFLKVAKLSP